MQHTLLFYLNLYLVVYSNGSTNKNIVLHIILVMKYFLSLGNIFFTEDLKQPNQVIYQPADRLIKIFGQINVYIWVKPGIFFFSSFSQDNDK